MPEQIVEVEWIDSCRTDGWHDQQDFGPALCRSAGYLLAKTEDKVTLALSLGDDTEHVCQTMTIPRVAVRKIRRLK